LISAGASKDLTSEIASVWNKYFSMSVGEGVAGDQAIEETMLKEYEMFKNLRPKVTKDKSGKLSLKGLEKFIEPQKKRKKDKDK
jgi:hypothetical protein